MTPRSIDCKHLPQSIHVTACMHVDMGRILYLQSTPTAKGNSGVVKALMRTVLMNDVPEPHAGLGQLHGDCQKLFIGKLGAKQRKLVAY